MIVAPTAGRLQAHKSRTYAVASFPASESEEWYDPWKENLKKARDMGNKLIVVGPRNMTFGKGQSLEIAKDLKGVEYDIVPVDTFQDLNARISAAEQHLVVLKEKMRAAVEAMEELP